MVLDWLLHNDTEVEIAGSKMQKLDIRRNGDLYRVFTNAVCVAKGKPTIFEALIEALHSKTFLDNGGHIHELPIE